MIKNFEFYSTDNSEVFTFKAFNLEVKACHTVNHIFAIHTRKLDGYSFEYPFEYRLDLFIHPDERTPRDIYRLFCEWYTYTQLGARDNP